MERGTSQGSSPIFSLVPLFFPLGSLIPWISGPFLLLPLRSLSKEITRVSAPMTWLTHSIHQIKRTDTEKSGASIYTFSNPRKAADYFDA